MGIDPITGVFTEGMGIDHYPKKSFFNEYLNISMISIQAAKEKKKTCAIDYLFT